MLGLRTVTVIGTMACAVLLACGDDSGDGGGGGGGGKVTAAQAAAGACTQKTSSGAQCEGIEEYTACVESACAAGYGTCLGANYKSGDFSGGQCETYMKCVAAADDACNSGCTIDGACQSCFSSNFTSCSSSCVSMLDCSGGAAGGGGAGTGSIPNNGMTCADLEACCNSLADASNKATCLQAHSAAKGAGDAACGQIAAVVCAGG